jgi:hypothetical protein
MNAMTEIEPDAKLSNSASIKALNVGECFSRAVRFDGDRLNKKALSAAESGLRLATQPTVHRIAKATGRVFTIECGEFTTRTRDLIMCLVVTRLPDPAKPLVKRVRARRPSE